MVQKVISQADAKALIDKQEEMRKRAARQAAKSLKAPDSIPTVEVTVLPAGHGRISMGEHVAGLGEAHYEEGETFNLDMPVAVALYDRGFVNFPGARDAAEKARRDRAEALAERQRQAYAATLAQADQIDV
jgi:hypothetical protein